jgi:alpha-tubulin suppressor-like RCC1 family protein
MAARPLKFGSTVTAAVVTVSLLAAPGHAAQGVGRVTAWGYNADGLLGNGSTTNSTVPVNTVGALVGKTVTVISVGSRHVCAVADGRAYCWGSNAKGQLGNNSTTDSLLPVAVDVTGVLAGKTVTDISAGLEHTCAVADGAAFCWGSNYYKALGNDSTMDSSAPVAVNVSGVLAGRTISAISAGQKHTCAISQGRAFCWGAGGRLGDGTVTESAVPVAVATSGVLFGKTVTVISANAQHTCAVADGQGFCWGVGLNGQLGNGANTSSYFPVAVNTSGPLASRTLSDISAGEFHSCAVAEGRAVCWGAGLSGELGRGSTTNSPLPVAVDTTGVLAGRTVTSISAGLSRTCAVADGRAVCWGFNGGGLGNNSAADSTTPVSVDVSGVLAGTRVSAISTAGVTAALAASAPKAPTAVVASPRNGEVEVSWTPADDGGSPVLEYVATATPGGASCSTTTRSCVVPGLTNGTAYTLTVTARNAIGASVASAPSTPVTPRTPAPGKVVGLKASVRPGKVKVTWKSTMGASTYRVRISKPGGRTFRAWKSTKKRAFSASVRQSAKYRFQVLAVGTGGRGPVTTIRFRGK